MTKELEGSFFMELNTGKGVDGGREIRGIKFATITIGNRQIDISEEVEILMERHSQELEDAVVEYDQKVESSILSDRAAGQFEGMRN